MLRFELEQAVVGVQKRTVQIVPSVVVAKPPVPGILAPAAVVAFLPAANSIGNQSRSIIQHYLEQRGLLARR